MPVSKVLDLRPLFVDLYKETLTLFTHFSNDEWHSPTISTKWLVRDIAAHMIDTDMRRLSFQRDNMPLPAATVSESELLRLINRLNNEWVETAKRLSPRILTDLFGYVAVEIPKLFNSLNLMDKAIFSVSWAGEDESTNEFDIAREFTEKWHHLQQICEATGKTILRDKKYVLPVIATFLRGLPALYQKSYPEYPDSTVSIVIHDLDKEWALVKREKWKLEEGSREHYTSKITLDADTAWRIFAKLITADHAISNIHFEGNKELALKFVHLTTFIK